MSAVCPFPDKNAFIAPLNDVTIKTGDRLQIAFWAGRPTAGDTLRVSLSLLKLLGPGPNYANVYDIWVDRLFTYQPIGSEGSSSSVFWYIEWPCGDTAIHYNWTIPELFGDIDKGPSFEIWGRFTTNDLYFTQSYSQDFQIQPALRNATVSDDVDSPPVVSDAAGTTSPVTTSSGQSNNQSLAIGLGTGLGVAALLAVLAPAWIIRRQRQRRNKRNTIVEEGRGFEKPEISGKMIGDSHCQIQELNGVAEVKELDSKSPIQEISSRPSDADRDSIDYTKEEFKVGPQELDSTEIRSPVEPDEGKRKVNTDEDS